MPPDGEVGPGGPQMDEAPREGGMTARERRAQRAKASARAAAPKKVAKNIAILLAAALVIAGGVWAFNQIPKVDREFIHWHSSFKMFVNEEDVLFDDCAFDLNPCGGHPGTGYTKGHLHVKDAYPILHQEGVGGRQLMLHQWLESLKVKASDAKVTLDESVHAGRVVENNATHTWQLWINHCIDGADSWKNEPALFDYKPRQHDRILMVYSDKSDFDTLKPILDQVPTEEQIKEVTKDKC